MVVRLRTDRVLLPRLHFCVRRRSSSSAALARGVAAVAVSRPASSPSQPGCRQSAARRRFPDSRARTARPGRTAPLHRHTKRRRPTTLCRRRYVVVVADVGRSSRSSVHDHCRGRRRVRPTTENASVGVGDSQPRRRRRAEQRRLADPDDEASSRPGLQAAPRASDDVTLSRSTGNRSHRTAINY